MEHVSLSAELGEIRYAIEGAHWIADSVAMGAVPDPERTHSALVTISAILLLVENRLHPLGRVLRGEENPAHLVTSHSVTGGEYADREDVILRPWDWSGAVEAVSSREEGDRATPSSRGNGAHTSVGGKLSRPARHSGGAATTNRGAELTTAARVVHVVPGEGRGRPPRLLQLGYMLETGSATQGKTGG